MRLVLLLLALPWWVFFLFAGASFYFGEDVHDFVVQDEADRAAALAAAPPRPVDLEAFSLERDVALAREVQVTGWIDTEHNYILESRSGGHIVEEYVYMLFGTDEGPEAREVRAVIILHEDDIDTFFDNIDSFIIGEMPFGDDDPIFQFNGRAMEFVPGGHEASDAILSEGLTKSDDFFYLVPFLEGREAGLHRTGLSAEEYKLLFRFAGVAFLILAAAKKLLRGRQQKAKETPDPMEATRAYSPQAPGGANKALDYDYAFKGKPRDVELSKHVTPDSPLGRIASGGASRAETPDLEQIQPNFDHPSERGVIQTALKARENFSKTAKTLGIGFVVVLILTVSMAGYSGEMEDDAMAQGLSMAAAVVFLIFVVVAGLWFVASWAKARFAVGAAGGKARVAQGEAALNGEPVADLAANDLFERIEKARGNVRLYAVAAPLILFVGVGASMAGVEFVNIGVVIGVTVGTLFARRGEKKKLAKLEAEYVALSEAGLMPPSEIPMVAEAEVPETHVEAASEPEVLPAKPRKPIGLKLVLVAGIALMIGGGVMSMGEAPTSVPELPKLALPAMPALPMDNPLLLASSGLILFAALIVLSRVLRSRRGTKPQSANPASSPRDKMRADPFDKLAREVRAEASGDLAAE